MATHATVTWGLGHLNLLHNLKPPLANQPHQQHPCGNAFEEVTVVADGNDCPLKLPHSLLQCLLAGDIQMVRGLIQDKQRALQANRGESIKWVFGGVNVDSCAQHRFLTVVGGP